MNFRKYRGGFIPSPKDDRDYKLSELISCSARLPEEYINPLVNEIEIVDQGSSLECVACSLAYLRYLTEYEQSNNRKRFSPSYIYANRSEDMYNGEGMIPREALKTLTNYGICHYADFSGFYDVGTAMRIYKSRSAELDAKAHPFRTSSYYAVEGENEIKTAVMNLGGVMVGYSVYDCMYSPDEDGKIHFSVRTKDYGNHMLTIVGWNDYGWICLNSWGREYGKDGICCVPYEYPISEAWAIVDEVKERFFMMFKDIENHWAKDDILAAVDAGIVNGYEDGTFKPDKPVTRAEAAAMIMRTLKAMKG